MSDDDDLPEEPPPEMAGWIMTFADLMSLLMCFFVLLLSFAEMDIQKFKQLSGSLDKAFGVQRKLKASSIPRGTSIIAREFTPGRPEPTPFNEVRQQAAPSIENTLVTEEKTDEGQKQEEETKRDAQKIAEHLLKELRAGKVEIESIDNKIVIRLLEEATFSSGSAELRESFFPIIKKITDTLVDIQGSITVAGFTDNVPISTDQFSSNWELSASRAVSVLSEIVRYDRINPKRLEVSGFAENRPLVPNRSAAKRARNRRVEIIILQGEQHEYDEEDVFEIDNSETDVPVEEFGGFELKDNDSEGDGFTEDAPFDTKKLLDNSGIILDDNN